MRIKLLSGVITLTVLFYPGINFAQAPTLGTAANFVLFSAIGAVSNTGISQLTGNIGTNSGASTGFGNVNGVMHDDDGASTQCAADLLIAYNQLDAAIPTFFPAPLLGNGDTLTAGVYKISGVTTLGGDLFLNAQGNANAVFIFQIEAAFSTNASSKIKLINGALACNVFWKVEGLVSMASATFMRGTIVANNAAIDMNVNDTLEGRALSTTGAVTINGILAYTPTGCGSPVLTGPVAPILASSACYAIFSSNGPVTNTGITLVTGDVGTNVGLTTGFDPLLVTGTIHPMPDGSTAACAADLLNVYNYLNVLPNDIELLYPAQFGRNLVLTPHTYLMNAAASFTDSLYLNAAGNANAVFVIKINGALTTSVNSKVILINGARAGNVFWKIEGAVTINDNSVFNGTIICNNGAINLNTGDSLSGRALTTTGAVNTAAIVARVPNGSGCSTILPISWLYFRGNYIQKTVLLEWGTANEMDNGFFTIEKSRDGQTFGTITTVNVLPGNGNQQHYYSFTDQQPYGLNYYRISQTDNNGQKHVYRTIQVITDINPGIKVLHYTGENYVYVQTTDASPGNGLIELYNMDGKKISSEKIIFTKELSTFKIVKPSQKGIYIVNLLSHGVTIYVGKVLDL